MGVVAQHPEIEGYLAGVGEPQRSTLVATRATLRALLPGAGEAMKYGMPTFVAHGHSIASYAAFKEHCGYFPHSSGVLTRAGDAIAEFPTSKGGLRFPVDRPLTKALVKRLVRLRLDELADVADGTRIECYDDGTLKATGRVRGGVPHGAWSWYRKDGSLQRTGAYRDGEPSGTWQTFDTSGSVVTTKRY